MANVRTTGTLEINDDPPFERRQFLIERVSWGLMALLIAAALTGALGGSGWLSSRVASSETGNLAIAYDRFVRRAATTQWILLGNGLTPGGVVTTEIGGTFLGNMSLLRVAPDPFEQASTRESLVLRFRNATDATTLAFELQPTSLGLHQIQITLGPTERVSFWVFAYP